MRHARLLPDRTDIRILVQDFDREMDEISRMHRYLIVSSERDFTAVHERLLEENNPEFYDGGDAIWDAEQELGITPWDVATHSGLLAISRAVALCEVMLARMAASLIREPERWVFPKSGLWMRHWEAQFYKTALSNSFKVDAAQYAAMRGLRDLYTHGYGVPATEERRQQLARRLYNACDTSAPTQEELTLGLGDRVYFFGEGADFSPTTQTLESKWLLSARADVSPLGAHRLLEMARAHIHDAHSAIAGGLVEDLTEENCKYVTTVNRWWEKEEG